MCRFKGVRGENEIPPGLFFQAPPGFFWSQKKWGGTPRTTTTPTVEIPRILCYNRPTMTNEFKQRYLDARKKVIEQEFSHLNAMQRQAVLTTQGPLLILAGAGSGKTTVLINRIENLLRFGAASDSDDIPETAAEEDITTMLAGGPAAYQTAALNPVDPWRIIAITFTNKAAGELKDRLAARLGPEANDIWAATFHSACVRILRRDADRLGFSTNFTIYDSSDSQSVMKHVLRDLDFDEKIFPPRTVLGELSRAKDQYISPLEYAQNAEKSGDVRKRKMGQAALEYTRRLYNAGAMDFDDLIYFTVKLLTEHTDVREYWQKKFQYVLVDEYQDTNRIQYLLATLLSGKWGNICVVGDDDQSIYKFRGATIENILSFERQYQNARVIRLEQNYRSTGHILEAANAVIANNTERMGKNLWTGKGDGDKLLLYVTQNQDEEAQYVAGKILESYAQGSNFRDHAVLYRMNAQSNQLEYAFKRNGIPYKVYGGMRFFDRAEVKDMLSYLCVIANPGDDLRLRRIINTPPRGIGARTIEQAAYIASQEQKTLYEVIRRAPEYEELRRAAPKLIAFVDMVEELRRLNETLSPDELYDELVEKSGYRSALEAKGTAEDTARLENIAELKTNIISYITDTGDTTLEGFLDDVALYTDLDSMDKDTDCVSMMTMHSAKGLEFPTVFIVGMEEGIFPGLRTIGYPDEMEEERRLCYVAMTRAQKNLYLTCARQRMLFGKTTSNLPSRFADEIPTAHMDKGGASPNKPRPVFDDDYGTVSRPEYGTRASRRDHPSRPKPAAPTGTKTLPQFQVGDRVNHKAFGPGQITKMTPMGGDALVEITFDTVGVKRLMLRAAGPNMEKL